MARTRRIKREGDACYHVMSRTNGKAFLFSDGKAKARLVELLKVSAAFSGVRIVAYCVMDNHFHAVCRVTKPDEPLSERDVVARIAILKGDRYAEEVAGHWADLRACGMGGVADGEVECWRRRMHDVSQFVKTFKELVNIWCKRECPHCGSIWSGRFASTLVEGGGYLRTCARYVELNAVRAGMVRRAEDYAYCSHGEGIAAEAAFCNGFAGTVPEERLLRRMTQVGAGKVFGSRAFVCGTAAELAGCFGGVGVRPRAVADAPAYTTHGHRLAKGDAA